MDHESPLLLRKFKSEGAFIRSLKLLQDGFTKDREKIGNYLDDPFLVSAYFLYYSNTNALKFQFLKNVLRPFWQKFYDQSFWKDRVLVDFGSGPGTFSGEFLKEFEINDLILFDTSELMLAQGKKYLSFLKERQEIRQNARIQFLGDKASLSRALKGKKVCLFFGHSLNEIGSHEFFEIINDFGSSVEDCIILEPGTNSVFKLILEVRAFLHAQGFSTSFPCSSNEDCGLKKDDWCHFNHFPKIPQYLERYGQMAKIDRRTMPLILHYFVRDKLKVISSPILRLERESKFDFKYEICRNNRIYQLSVLKKKFKKSEQKALKYVLGKTPLFIDWNEKKEIFELLKLNFVGEELSEEKDGE